MCFSASKINLEATWSIKFGNKLRPNLHSYIRHCKYFADDGKVLCKTDTHIQ